MENSLEKLNKKYELELDKIIQKIKEKKYKKILLQFPEGLKPYSTTISDKIEKQTKIKPIIWMGTCYGACDIPQEIKKLGIDFFIQFGHTKWKN